MRYTPHMPKPSAPEEQPLSMDEKMDMILVYLHRMDRRDRTRMIGAYIKSMFTLASLLILVGSSVWFLLYGQQFIQDLTEQMVEQMTEGAYRR